MIEIIRLMHGDCLELMGEVEPESVDLVLTDPPYGIDFQSVWKKDKAKRFGKILNDKAPFVSCIPLIKPLVKNRGGVLLFTRWDVQQKFIDAMKQNGFDQKNILIWDKVIHGMGDLKKAYGNRYESIIWCPMKDFRFPGKRPTDIIVSQRVQANKLLHPNEKPIELLEKLIIQTTNEGDTVLDFCMGSGSTGVACVNTGRNFIGIELDDHYFEVAEERIRRAQDDAATGTGSGS